MNDIDNNQKENKPENSVQFIKSEDMGQRDWGTETLLGLVPGNFTLKKLFIKKGCKGGLQYHHKKNELGHLLSGKLLIRFVGNNGNLTETTIYAGGNFHFPPGAVHQEEAIEDCIIIEASTPHFNDRVRVEGVYGIEVLGGLPSTKIEDVEER